MTGGERVVLGRSGLRVSRIGLGSSFGLGASDVERAFDRGINYFYWGSLRKAPFGEGMRAIAKRDREGAVFVVQTYSRAAFWIRRSLEGALSDLGTDYADVLLLGWWPGPPPARILDAARAIVESGKARHVMVSCHQRPMFRAIAEIDLVDTLMVRYNAVHPGAEEDVFPTLAEPRPGIVAYTATRWGHLLRPDLVPDDEPRPRASDCYRFALSHPSVDVVLAGPRHGEDLDEALAALSRPPMDEEERAWMKRVGKVVKERAPSGGSSLVRLGDRMSRLFTS